MIKRFFALSAATLITSFALSAQQYNDGLIEKTIALIGNDAVMLSDIESEVQMMRANGLVADRNARCDLFEEILINKLFLTQARLDSLMVTPPEIQDNLTQRIARDRKSDV